MSTPVPLVVIGAGPGGYVAAFHAADLGIPVTLIDREPNPGGVCLYRGCIPSKALLHTAKIITDADGAANLGITFTKPNLDLDKLRNWKDNIVARLTGGLGQLSRQRKITYIQGDAKFLSPTTLEIKKTDGSLSTLSFDKAIIATGSRPAVIPSLPLSQKVWDSTGALRLSRIPGTLLVVGGGYIGLELGSAYAALGSKVSVVEALPQLLNGADRDLADILVKRLKKIFVKTMTETTIAGAEETADGIRVTLKDKAGVSTSETYQQLLVAVGRRPNTEDLGIDTLGVRLDAKGFITVDAQRRTSVANIFAIGDVAGNPMLAHKASYEAKVAAAAVAGLKSAYDPKAIPAVVYTDPEIAWCGVTEDEARAKGLDITVFKFPWAASGRALTIDRVDGLTKIIAETTTKRVLGVGIAGVGAGDLIAEGVLAMEMGAVAEDLANTIHPHPTLSETFMETAEGLFGQSTHILRPKKSS